MVRLITVTSCKLPVTPKEPVGRSVEQKLIPCAESDAGRDIHPFPTMSASTHLPRKHTRQQLTYRWRFTLTDGNGKVTSALVIELNEKVLLGVKATARIQNNK